MIYVTMPNDTCMVHYHKPRMMSHDDWQQRWAGCHIKKQWISCGSREEMYHRSSGMRIEYERSLCSACFTPFLSLLLLFLDPSLVVSSVIQLQYCTCTYVHTLYIYVPCSHSSHWLPQ